MKIIQIIHKPQHRGAEVFASQLSGHLVSLGHQVKVVSVYEGKADLPFDGKITSLEASPSKRFFDLAAWKRLNKIIREFEPDVVQANAGDTLKYAVFSKIIFNWKVPIFSRNASEIGRYLTNSIQKNLNSFLYKRVDRVISVSKASENDILEHFPFLEGRTEVIPVGLERIKIPRDVVLEPGNKKHIVHVGGFTFEKNHKGLIEIILKVLKKHPNVFLHLLGDGPLKKEVEEQVKENNLSQYVKFYGFVNNPLSYIRGADVLVLPSIIEGLPGVLLEAMYCKIPVVAYNVGGISEIVNENTGFLIEKDRKELFATAILEILEKENDLMIKTAYKIVSEQYMNDRITEQFVRCYSRFLD
ncbi:glycosyltransferase [Salinimicrobium terrae]|uniref:glycosyltransferase n=1 Tax=Salinimicrobium terrae TaxID=470866 RepID=UPI000411F38E|nr:glycosyltransferase [Salinimicrobium terrae]